MSHKEFADGTQLYDSVCLEHIPPLVSLIQSCVSDVKDWVTENKLQLDRSSDHILSKVQQSPTVYSGVIFDSKI